MLGGGIPTATVNQTELFYIQNGKGTPCLVMHGGLGLDHTYLRGLDDLVGDALRLVYYDHRHNGRSGRPPLESVTHAQLADDAEGLRKHLGLEKVVVLGHSYGGFIALEYAVRYPKSVSNLILVDTAPALNYGEEIGNNAIAKGATPLMLKAMATAWTDDADAKGQWEVIFPLYFRRYDPAYNAVMADTIFCADVSRHQGALLSTYDVLPRLHEIGVPTLILVGRDDFICPPSQAKLLKSHISDSRLVVFEHSGHFPWIEEPALFSRTVKEWLISRST